MEKAYNFDEFRKIIADLRSPGGCPWDREQTHETLKPCMTEEAAELVAAIRIYQETGDDENLCEELGDVLLQVLMHSQIAEEEGRFTIDTVIQKISEKMIRRHPHVFADAHASTSGQVLQKWDEIKKQEKAGKTWIKQGLHEIPPELPALIRSQKIQKKTEKLYNQELPAAASINTLKQILSTMESDTPSSEETAPQQIGGLLWHAANIARHYNIHAEQALTDRIEDEIIKFDK